MTIKTDEHPLSTDTDNAVAMYQAAMRESEQTATGDTGDQPEHGGAPTTTTDQNDSKESAEAQAEKQVLMAKDGVHTIPYEKLTEARSSSQHWQAQAEAAQQELQALRAEAQARADQGQAPTRTDNMVAAAEAAIDAGADPADFGDFSEEALVAGIDKTVEAKVRTRVDKAVQAALDAALAPLRKQEQEQQKAREHSAVEAHHNAILTAHPDASSVVQSAEMEAWVKAQPSYVQPGIRQVLEEGTTGQVIELISSFKESTGAVGKGAQGGRQAAAQAAIQRAQSPIPNSLSDIPGGRAGGSSLTDRMASMSEVDLFNAVNSGDITTTQLDAYLNRKS